MIANTALETRHSRGRCIVTWLLLSLVSVSAHASSPLRAESQDRSSHGDTSMTVVRMWQGGSPEPMETYITLELRPDGTFHEYGRTGSVWLNGRAPIDKTGRYVVSGTTVTCIRQGDGARFVWTYDPARRVLTRKFGEATITLR